MVVMAKLATTFEDAGLNDSRCEIYFEALEDLDIRVIAKGATELIRYRKYKSFPTPGEIREAALGGDREDEEAAVRAWALACKQLASGRENGDDRVSRAVIAAFGSWRVFGETSPDNEVADRAHFVKCYKAVSRESRRAPSLYLSESEPLKIGSGGEGY